MERRELLYKGKAKSVYFTDDADKLILHYLNDTSAFDGEKIEQLDRKGEVNNKFSAFIMKKLEEAGVPTHHEGLLSADEALVKKMEMFPIECVVRNIAAGSVCKRLGIEEGIDLDPATFEFFLKNDALHDPMINEYHIRTFGWADDEAVEKMKELTFKVNDFISASLMTQLIYDHDIEFGFDTTGDGVYDSFESRVQFKELFGLGLTYSF